MSFWGDYERAQRTKLAARSKAVSRCAICQEPVLKGKRCPTCISSRAEGEEKAAQMRAYRTKMAARRARA